MKSLLSIINKLSQNEVETFRLFLSNQGKSRKNKKLELFNRLVNQDNDYENLPSGKSNSRQSVYQLKKRLQEDLYSFLLSQHQPRNDNDELSLEMDCHKKLYCFKILFDKGVREHAWQILNEVLTVSAKHYLHNIYLEAVSLKNVYFPLDQISTQRKILVNTQIKRLKKSISRNLYINQYLSESRTSLHESDVCFRRKLINALVDFDLGENEWVIEQLMAVNHSFHQGDFVSAYQKLLKVAETDQDLSGDVHVRGLIDVELTKACICLNDIDQAKKWLGKAEFTLSGLASFASILMELRFIADLRTLDSKNLEIIVEQARGTREINENEVLSAKWSYHALFLNFQKREFKKVIKVANGNPIFILKNKSWLLNVKILEILSIYQLGDIDWLYYKIESLRKIISGSEGKYQRFNQIINLIKSHLSGKQFSPAEVDNKIIQIEQQFPWHPLSNELVNFCGHIKNVLKVDTSVSLAES